MDDPTPTWVVPRQEARSPRRSSPTLVGSHEGEGLPAEGGRMVAGSRWEQSRLDVSFQVRCCRRQERPSRQAQDRRLPEEAGEAGATREQTEAAGRAGQAMA